MNFFRSLTLLPVLAAAALPPSATVKFRTLTHGLSQTVENAGRVTAPMKMDTVDGDYCVATPKGLAQGKPTPADSNSGGKITFELPVETEDDYTLFAEVRWNGEGNSFWVKLDSLPDAKLGNDGPDTQWIPIRGPLWHLFPGKHSVIIREREWGAALRGVHLLPVPAYIAGALAFGSTVTLDDTSGFKNGRFFSKMQKLLISPSFALSDDSLSFRFFLADTGRQGILAPAKHTTVSILASNGKVLYAGDMALNTEATVTLANPLPGKYVVRAGNLKAEWHFLSERFSRISQGLDRLQQGKKSEALDFWLPTLELCRRNILRGYKIKKLGEEYLPDQHYVLSEMARAEEMTAALKNGAPERLIRPGVVELAYYSPVDSALSPYTLSLPKAYFETRQRLPWIFYLHGSAGTQWEIVRNAEANHRPLSDLTLPIAVPFARGNVGYDQDTVEADLLTLLRTLPVHFRLDTARTILSGFSKGGIGTWYLGCKYSSRFSALIPVAGGLPWERYKDFKAWKPKDRLFPEAWLGKIIILHGLLDQTVSIDMAESVQAQLTREHTPFQMVLYKTGHEIPPTLFDVYNNLEGALRKITPYSSSSFK